MSSAFSRYKTITMHLVDGEGLREGGGDILILIWGSRFYFSHLASAILLAGILGWMVIGWSSAVVMDP
jgi:hypothetical protein